MASAQIKSKGSYRDNVRAFFDAERANDEKIRRAQLGLSEDEEIPRYQHQSYPRHLPLSTDPNDFVEVSSEEEEQRAVALGAFPDMQAAQEAEAKAKAEQDSADVSANAILTDAATKAEAIRKPKPKPVPAQPVPAE